jgi:hypothetical protein
VTRLFWIGLFMLAAVAFNAFLLINEQVSEPDVKEQAETADSDPYQGMRFNPTLRRANLAQLGFDDAEIDKVQKRIEILEDRYRLKDPDLNQIRLRIDAVSDRDDLATSLCTSANALPSPYAAMPWLVEERDGQLSAVDVSEKSAFERDRKWSAGVRFEAAYRAGDRTEDRKPDAAKMTLAALLTRQEGTLIDRKSPWGGSLLAGWSWESVKKQHRGIEERVVNYVALLHLVMETATAEDSLCTT